jgi:MscS family membrane protein
VERYTEQRVPPANFSATVSLLRVGTTLIDIVIVIAGVLVLLRHFGVDPTPILAGLGVGGIAVALAAQKTLENVIAGASLIFDQAVRLGDSLRVGTIEGTVEEIGLRSTRIRTNDRTLVSVPNSQIASVSLETLSARDKFWFHPVLPLTYETTSEQLHVVLDGIRQLLSGHPVVERGSVRVRLLRLGSFSQDVEVFAYVYARDWVHFLEIQEELLFKVTSIVQRAGTQIAFPTQRLYLDGVNAATSQLPISK